MTSHCDWTAENLSQPESRLPGGRNLTFIPNASALNVRAACLERPLPPYHSSGSSISHSLDAGFQLQPTFQIKGSRPLIIVGAPMKEHGR